MLQALRSKKWRREEVHEHELASAVFGGLRYLPREDTWRLLRAMVGDIDQRVDIGQVIDLELVFWPCHRRLRDPLSGRQTEPDLLFELRCRSVVYRVPVEVRWRSGPRSCEERGAADRLQRQWRALRSCWPPETLLAHVYLTRDTAMPPEVRAVTGGDDPEHAARLRWFNWYRLLEILEESARDLSVAGWRWSGDVTQALARLGLVRFSGFSVGLFGPLSAPGLRRPLFGEHHQFGGFRDERFGELPFEEAAALPEGVAPHVFFAREAE